MTHSLVLDGKRAAAALEAELAQAVAQLVAQGHRAPHLAAIRVGALGPSVTYVTAKLKACARVGYRSTLIELPDTVTQAELLAHVAGLNADPAVDGFIVQLPLPGHIAEAAVLEAVLPSKDIDGFHPVNLGRLAQGLPTFAPATPAGVVALLHHYGIETEGRHAVVVGRSSIVGTPLALLLSRNSQPGNCTVTVCHSRTPNLAHHTRQADLLLVAAGRQGLITPDHVKPGAVVVDVGIHRVPDDSKQAGYRLLGDVDPAVFAGPISAYSPVPGGVGPMTIALLLQNTLTAYQRAHGLPG
ncbi:MAG: bifunctional 5,10-methylenetetrahydrofolate dehydrogenase/5,10-methenyltetrahydrofolate cyclohydrolase [Bacteroidia bacterium]|nr:bifunctional 5,10-methylenetetrahydrofolate dehydrogenase/5,10-methenyltetrahydrofolate cyclohydrolase [Bacteroidia bacterium]